MNTPRYVIYIVVGSLAGMTIIFFLTLCMVVIRDPTNSAALGNMKDVGLIALGALTALLTKTEARHDPIEPMIVANAPDHPIQVEAQPATARVEDLNNTPVSPS